MNAEQAIASAVAALRGTDGPQGYGVAAGHARPSHRTPLRNQAGSAPGFLPQTIRGGAVTDPWPRRPGLARAARAALESSAELASRPTAIVLAASLFLAGLVRVASHLASSNGPVIVHLVWPV